MFTADEVSPGVTQPLEIDRPQPEKWMVFGPYEIQFTRQLLGTGGMGSVEVALIRRHRTDPNNTTPQLEISVAVKTALITHNKETNDELADALSNEIAMVHELSLAYPWLIPHMLKGLRNNLGDMLAENMLIMERLGPEWQQLRDIINAPEKIPVTEVLKIALGCVKGLIALRNHKSGISHQDLKPVNISYNRKTGRVKFLDLGLFGKMGQKKAQVAGTLTYMAPEQILNREMSPSSDLFSVALIIYELFTGEPFLSGQPNEQIGMLRIDPNNPVGLNENHVQKLADSLKGQLPPENIDAVITVLHTALQRDPALRYPSAEDFMLALSAACGLNTGIVTKDNFVQEIDRSLNHTINPVASPEEQFADLPENDQPQFESLMQILENNGEVDPGKYEIAPSALSEVFHLLEKALQPLTSTEPELSTNKFQGPPSNNLADPAA